MIIDEYGAGDAREVRDLFTSVFTDSEGQAEGELIGQLVHELQQTTPADDIYGFTAKEDKAVVGCVYFTRMRFENRIIAFILSPLAVASRYQKQGIGQKLIRYGIQQLKNNSVELVLTYGDPAYYSKSGFQQISEALIMAPLELSHPDGWLAQSLVSDSIEPIAGESSCVSALNRQEYW